MLLHLSHLCPRGGSGVLYSLIISRIGDVSKCDLSIRGKSRCLCRRYLPMQLISAAASRRADVISASGRDIFGGFDVDDLLMRCVALGTGACMVG